MYVISPGGELVGFSEWPWDRLYAPVVGCFAGGTLSALAVCDAEPQRAGLRGPSIRCWFRMRLEPSVLRRLQEGDSTIRLLRLEDGAPVERADGPSSDSSSRLATTERATDGAGSLARVEDLLSAAEVRRTAPLDGFSSLLIAPLRHQLDCVYLDILGRPIDPGGMSAYGMHVENGSMSLLKLRDILLVSDEFRDRRLRIHDRVGALMTSRMWGELARLDSPGESRRRLTQFRLRDYEALGQEGFVQACYELLLGRPEADPVGLAHYAAMAERDGRAAVVSELSREAAHLGMFFEVVER